MQTNWILSESRLPEDGELKLVSIRDGSDYYHGIARYNQNNNTWIYNDNSIVEAHKSIRAWAELLPIYLG